MPQDMPPSGGYQPVQFKRNLPIRGFRPQWYLFGMLGVMTWGFYKFGQGQRELHEYAREKMWARLHLVPLLQAESDRDQVRRYYANEARAKELLDRDIVVYHSDRFIKPSYAITPGKGGIGNYSNE